MDWELDHDMTYSDDVPEYRQIFDRYQMTLLTIVLILSYRQDEQTGQNRVTLAQADL